MKEWVCRVAQTLLSSDTRPRLSRGGDRVVSPLFPDIFPFFQGFMLRLVTNFPVQLTRIRIGNFITRLICTLLYVMTTNAYICTVACTLNPRLLSGHHGVVAGTLRGFFFPVRYGSVGVQFTRLRALCQGTLTSECVKKI